MKARLLLLLALVLIVGCQTLRPIDQSLVEELQVSAFKECQDSDGTFVLDYRSPEAGFAVELDWLFRRPTFQLESYNPLGITIYKAKIDIESMLVTTSGRVSGISEQVSLDSMGNLIIAGYHTAFNVKDLPCLFEFSWPKRWLPMVKGLKRDDERSYLVFGSKNGTIITDFDERESRPGRCSVISWSHYLGLVTRSLDICFKKDQAVVLNYDNTITINLMKRE